nr:MAG TPA: hypothetical protein [Caudoviricetes sp.]
MWPPFINLIIYILPMITTGNISFAFATFCNMRLVNSYILYKINIKAVSQALRALSKVATSCPAFI